MDRRDFVKGAALAGAVPLMGSSFSDGVSSSDRVSSRSEPGEQATREGRLIVDGLDTSIVNAEFLGLLRQGGVDCMHKSMGGFPSYGALYGFLDDHGDEAVVATTVGEIYQARSDGKISFVLGAQSANVLERLLDKSPTGTYAPMVTAMRAFYELGLRTHSICYNLTNIFGGGCLDHDVPLTRAGHRLVEEIHGLQMLLDVGGHTGERTSLDAIEISSGVPVVCTHTNVAALNPNPRAISDRLFEAIAGTGGVIGITAVSDFQKRSPDNYREHGDRSPQATLDDHLDQYDYVKQLIGVDHVGLGPDFVWGWGETFDHDPSVSMAFPSEVLGPGIPQLTRDFENISKLPNLIAGLEGRGWTEEDLDKVLGGNWLRVYEQVWG